MKGHTAKEEIMELIGETKPVLTHLLTGSVDATTMRKAEFVAKVFSDIPKESAEQVVEIASAYLDGITAGIRIAERRREKELA